MVELQENADRVSRFHDRIEQNGIRDTWRGRVILDILFFTSIENMHTPMTDRGSSY